MGSGCAWRGDAHRPNGEQHFIGLRYGARPNGRLEGLIEGTLPNGFALSPEGQFLIANFGTDAFELMQEDGRTTQIFDSIDGVPVGKVNFVLRDSAGRYWITVFHPSCGLDCGGAPDLADGYIILWERGGRHG
jgi:sugar lactone lactonase YvrE